MLPTHEVQLSVSACSSNLALIRFIVLEILRFLYFAVLAWNCLFTFTSIWMGWGHFPQIWSPIVLTPKRTILAQKHVVWAIKRKICSAVRPGRRIEKKGKDRTVRQKSHKVVIFRLFGEKPHSLCGWNQNFRGGSSRRHNHACKVSRCYFQGLRFYRGSNFQFFYWFLHGPYNSAARLRCLWFMANHQRHLNSRINKTVIRGSSHK